MLLLMFGKVAIQNPRQLISSNLNDFALQQASLLLGEKMEEYRNINVNCSIDDFVPLNNLLKHKIDLLNRYIIILSFIFIQVCVFHCCCRSHTASVWICVCLCHVTKSCFTFSTLLSGRVICACLRKPVNYLFVIFFSLSRISSVST